MPDDVLLDIGCSDASLLWMASEHASKWVGVSSSVEAQKRLESAFPGLSFMASQTHSLPLDSASGSKIVCQATLFYLPAEGDVRAAMREMARLARSGACLGRRDS